MGDHYQHKQAARVAYEVLIGPIPDEARIVTKCGTPGCIAPHHLYAKSKEMFYLDMQAESMASLLVHEEGKERRYRLSLAQIREVDGMLRTVRLGLLEGKLTRAEFDHEMLRIEQYVGFITAGCVCPSIEQAVGAPIPDERRWDSAGLQPPDTMVVGPKVRRAGRRESGARSRLD